MINGIYEAAKERGLVRSLRHFSEEFLHRAPNYLADTGFEGCSAGALLNLYRRLGEIGHVDLQARAFERLLDAEARDGRAQAARA
jgi:hypothetical protein